MLDAIIVIGCVIQGETKHFDFVCEGVTQGIKDLNLEGNKGHSIVFLPTLNSHLQNVIRDFQLNPDKFKEIR